MWSQNWGTMIWGSASAPVPSLGPLGLLLLALSLMLLGAVFLRTPRAVRIVSKLALVVALLVPITAIAVPYTFTNGTVANAQQVNANFAALETRLAALEAVAPTQARAQTVCTQAATAANVNPPNGITHFYDCFSSGDSIRMADPDGYCGNAHGGGPFYAWYFAGPKAGQKWLVADQNGTLNPCVPTTLLGSW